MTGLSEVGPQFRLYLTRGQMGRFFFANFASSLRPLRLKEGFNRKVRKGLRKEDDVRTKKRLPTKVGHTLLCALCG